MKNTDHYYNRITHRVPYSSSGFDKEYYTYKNANANTNTNTNTQYNQSVQIYNKYSYLLEWLGWLGLIGINWIINIYIRETLNTIVEEFKCTGDLNCDYLTELLIDKSWFLSNFYGYFCLGLGGLAVLDVILKLNKKFYFNIINVYGIIYLTSGFWFNSLVYMYYFNADFYYQYNPYKTSHLDYLNYLDPLMLIKYYYMGSEIIVLSVGLVPLLLILMIGFLEFVKFVIRKKIPNITIITKN